MLDITKIIAESLGTFVLMLAVLMFKNPVFIAVGFLIAIYASGDYSGGHINPAVSIAQVVKGDLPMSVLPGYISAQVFGAVAAVYVAKRLRKV
jgi:glycerol uptake facilitator-like aquaporin